MLPLKDISNFWRTLEIHSINCKINLILTWSENCFIAASTETNQVPTFAITDIKLYGPVVTLLTQDNAKLLQERLSGTNINQK